MSSALEQYLPQVESIDAAEAALVFRTVYNACDELSYLHTFLQMADKTGTEIEVSAVPGMIRQTERLMRELYDAYVLLCPSIDEGYVADLLRENCISPRLGSSDRPRNLLLFSKEQ